MVLSCHNMLHIGKVHVVPTRHNLLESLLFQLGFLVRLEFVCKNVV